MKINCFLFVLLGLELSEISCQVNYYNDKWPIPTKVYESIEFHRKLCKNPLTDYYNGTIEKLVVSIFIGQFKFSGKDARLNHISMPNSFQGNFPQPPLTKLDRVTKRMCELDSEHCVHFIFKQLKLISLQEINYKYGPNTYPGKQHHIITISHKNENMSPLRLFQFQATSMIYLCYWSILVDDPINEMGWSCLFPGKKYKRMVKSECIINATCPNPCCGHERVNNTNKDCDVVGKTRCSFLSKNPGSKCTRKEGHHIYREIPINEFAASGPQYDCQCSTKQEWHTDYLACLDEDECLKRTHKCDSQTQYCVNRPKGYFCACRWDHRPVERYKCDQKQLNELSPYKVE